MKLTVRFTVSGSTIDDLEAQARATLSRLGLPDPRDGVELYVDPAAETLGEGVALWKADVTVHA